VILLRGFVKTFFRLLVNAVRAAVLIGMAI